MFPKTLTAPDSLQQPLLEVTSADPAVKPKSGKYIAAIDGLRGISVLFVIFGHLSATLTIPPPFRASTLGRGGVIVFFVISGFLITSQLRNELEKTGTLNLIAFYIRRSLRLVPAVLLLILVSVLLAHWQLLPLTTADTLHALTYTVNYSHPDTNTLLHLWSLSVEEQFYLLWPFLIFFFPKRAIPIALGVVLMCPLLRIVGWSVASDFVPVSWHFEMVADSLALGCLLALASESVRKMRLLSMSGVGLLAFGLIIACCGINRHHPELETINSTIEAFAAAFLVASVTFWPDTFLARVLRWRPIVWIGALSYSVYLWQEMFCLPSAGYPVQAFQRFPANIILTFAAASISYYLIEAPIRKWGRRFKPSAAPGLDQRVNMLKTRGAGL